jgi:hypothetical protein
MDLKGRTANPASSLQDILKQLSQLEKKAATISNSSARDFTRLQQKLTTLTTTAG